MKNSFKLFLSLCLVISGLAFGGMKANAGAPEEGYITFEKINDSILKIKLDNAESYIDEKGNAFIKDNITGAIVELPQQSLDKNDLRVNLVYQKDGNDLLVELHSTGIQLFGFWQCTLGTLGGAGTGALGGMGIGAVAATPVTVLGGGVFGGIFGGMTGAAAACF